MGIVSLRRRMRRETSGRGEKEVALSLIQAPANRQMRCQESTPLLSSLSSWPACELTFGSAYLASPAPVF
ncbi:Uncharacterized protein TCM_007537 [Theobroma cacao]|uniref:Uncharacterized protein n=1 Tax=Theobroma cacao TaxID=3641 RepID=A0A061E1E2_THECC|nr:Uncharacterized protein TCM_007537 [Theobroma cacao]